MSEQFQDNKLSAGRSYSASFPAANEPGWETIYLFNSGSHEAFEEVYHKLYPYVFFFACRFVDREDAADITAEAFCKLWNREKNFTSLRKIKTFLQICVRNACINFLEKARWREHKVKDLTGIPEMFGDGDPESDEVRASLLERIFREIEKLPEGARLVFRLSVIERMDSKEISRKLGITHSTVRNQKKRAIALIRMAIGQTEIAILLAFLARVFPS